MKLALEILLKEVYKLFFFPEYRRFIILVFFWSAKKRFTKYEIGYKNIKFRVPDVLSFIWQIKEIFVDECYKFSPKSENPVIIDCGSNIGVSCIYFSKNYPLSKIIGFEADNDIYETLRSNLIANNCSNVEVFNKAVWIKNDGIRLLKNGADGASISNSENSVEVSSVRLKEFISQFDEIGLLKMDIEGAETEVLLDCGDELKRAENIFIEYHAFVSEQQRLDEILNLLTILGFRYFIKPEADRKMPFINKFNKNNPVMDLQLNIFAYRYESSTHK